MKMTRNEKYPIPRMNGFDSVWLLLFFLFLFFLIIIISYSVVGLFLFVSKKKKNYRRLVHT